MTDLIKALQILLKYGDPKYPTHCTYDCLRIMDISPVDVSDDDKAELERLGFVCDEDEDCFYSFKFGSA